ncbi:hypothetical protein [Sphingobium boeckii]|uniref:Uncharacterized protein n=1 Tax=Sphingobium boeckii TaxID=1082345 RepID=A0A7W9AIN3_9SPHN|nr:hypothetical protein [Sphingobium boeckii]MBB5686187.1 hypothetical protein [Sphingobium boeckii]
MTSYTKTPRTWLALALMLMPIAQVHAQTGAPSATTGQRAGQAARQPLEDFNIAKDEIPPKLIAIQDDPYATKGIKTCRQISDEVEALNAVLGADVDSTDEEKRKTIDTAIDVGGGLLTGLIPFRGIVREVTGANAATKRYQRALYSGISRRSFMKGMGKAKGCKPPAAPKAIVMKPAEEPKDEKAKK